MKVYLLFESFEDVTGVFSSRENAAAYARRRIAKGDWPGDESALEESIDEYEVDDRLEERE